MVVWVIAAVHLLQAQWPVGASTLAIAGASIFGLAGLCSMRRYVIVCGMTTWKLVGCGVLLLATRAGASDRVAPDGALGSRWIELETDHGVLVAQETEVTMAQWHAVMGEGLPFDRTCQSPQCPATDITPLSMMAFANRLSDLEGLDRCYEIVGGEGDVALGRLAWPSTVEIKPHCAGYRLPTREEWGVLIGTEPYARPGTPEKWLHRVGWVSDARQGMVAMPVAQKWPSYAGLYDLIGNVAEVVLLPWPTPDVAIVDDTLYPANLALLGCWNGGRLERCYWPHYPAPTFVRWNDPIFGFRLVRAY